MITAPILTWTTPSTTYRHGKYAIPVTWPADGKNGKALSARIDDPLVKDTDQNNLEHTFHMSCGNTDEP